MLVQAIVGPAGGPGEEAFEVVVVTPRFLEKLGGPRWGHGKLLVDEFDWVAVRIAIEKVLAACDAETWPEVASKLGRYLHWEFDGYRDA